eukprot:TRINITY_DN4102_c0_g1_i1.p1 TRINITY_DN4102_c0_g1~~TRINITY_DN4102_c0_g1_i1.p1  ORF type:complete len:153 (-),score=30.60 TRINITY_DN4102_c0_g1_i1:50-508(-)
MVFGFHLSNAISYVVGFLYPAYKSFKALETPETDDDVQFLTYWVVYSFFNFLEFFADVVISWIPLYYELKIAALVYLQYNNSAAFIYKSLIRPFLLKNEKLIDKNIDQLGRQALNASKIVISKSPQVLSQGMDMYNKYTNKSETKTEETKTN